jgi:hypothetical protein
METMMIWKSFAITRRKRLLATALLYGFSLTVRLTSATGEEANVVPAAPCSTASTSPHPSPEAPAFPTSAVRCHAGCERVLPILHCATAP